MQIIKNRELSQSEWVYIPAVDGFESKEISNPDLHYTDAAHSRLVAYSHWLSLETAARQQVAGIYLLPEDSLSINAHELDEIKVIGVVFPAFNEGRGYTQATILRNQLQYSGELRAINAYRDNLVLLEECGFDAFEINQTEDINDALLAFDELELTLN